MMRNFIKFQSNLYRLNDNLFVCSSLLLPFSTLLFPSLRLMPPTPKALGFEILRFEVWEFRIQDLSCKIQDLRFLSFVRLESWELRCRGFELWESKNKLTWQVSCTPYRMWSVLLLEPHFIDLCFTRVAQIMFRPFEVWASGFRRRERERKVWERIF